MMRAARGRGAWMVVGLCIAACGGRASDAPTGDGDASCTPALSQRVRAHACQHARMGPYVELVASAGAVEGPVIDAVHRVFEITMPEATDPRATRHIVYRAVRDGAHAFFIGPIALGLEVEAVESAARSALEHEEILEGSAGCGGVERIEVRTLQRGLEYRLVLEPADSPQGFLYIEHLATFGDEAWQSPECLP